MSKKNCNNNILTLAKQKLLLDKKYPESSSTINHNRLVWECKLRPTPLSRVYSVQMVCQNKENPKVYLLGKVKGTDRADFPHHYEIENNKVRLCLHLPCEFDYSMPLSDTIVPWTIEWLYYYEMWLATGEWLGGGKHPNI